MCEINIEKIMEEIRNKIKNESYDEILDFEQVPIYNTSSLGEQNNSYCKSEMETELYNMNHNWFIEEYAQINTKNIFIIFVKKVIRRITIFITVPAIKAQNEFNANTVRCMNQVYKYMEKIEGMENKVKNLEEEIFILKKELIKQNKL